MDRHVQAKVVPNSIDPLPLGEETKASIRTNFIVY
jgi:hypothetical protein